MISCICEKGRCDYQLYSKVTRQFDFIQSEYWLEMLNFKCQGRPEMEHNVGNGEIGRLRVDDDADDYQSSSSASALSILQMIQG